MKIVKRRNLLSHSDIPITDGDGGEHIQFWPVDGGAINEQDKKKMRKGEIITEAEALEHNGG